MKSVTSAFPDEIKPNTICIVHFLSPFTISVPNVFDGIILISLTDIGVQSISKIAGCPVNISVPFDFTNLKLVIKVDGLPTQS